ncbi:MAG: protein-L-isoaspartate O-methyltransferase family protein [Promethearchaeota archaeon]
MNPQKAFTQLIDKHIKRGYLKDKSYRALITEVPIYKLIDNDDDLIRYFVKDKPILCYYKDESDFRTVTAPHMVSVFISMLELSEQDEVLILGAKGGFISSIIANIVNQVYILEEHPKIAEITKKNLNILKIRNAKVINKNPLLGLEDLSPFDKILITGAIKEIPNNIFDQLSYYGILVAPIKISDNNQQVIQFIKTKKGIEKINFGGVRFQDLYFSKIQYKPEKIRGIQINNSPFTETFAELPKIEILDVAFDHTFGERNQKIDIDAPSYLLHYKIRNNSNKRVPIQVKLEMPSLEKENITDIIPLKPKCEIVDNIIASNPKREGKHHFNLIVCDENNHRLNKITSCIDIKKKKRKKALEITLTILRMTIPK